MRMLAGFRSRWIACSWMAWRPAAAWRAISATSSSGSGPRSARRSFSVCPLDVLHHEVAVRHVVDDLHVGVVRPHHVRVADALTDVSLLLKPLEVARPVEEVRVQDLDGESLVAPDAEIDRAHGARAEALGEEVVSQPLPDQRNLTPGWRHSSDGSSRIRGSRSESGFPRPEESDTLSPVRRRGNGPWTGRA
jgi:hypothetical protein